MSKKDEVMKIRPAMPIMLDKERHLLLDLNAMVAFQEETGKNLFDASVTKALKTSFGPKELRVLLWACLLHEDENLTLKQVGSWLHIGNMDGIADKLMLAWSAAMPEGGKDDAPLARESRTG